MLSRLEDQVDRPRLLEDRDAPSHLEPSLSRPRRQPLGHEDAVLEEDHAFELVDVGPQLLDEESAIPDREPAGRDGAVDRPGDKDDTVGHPPNAVDRLGDRDEGEGERVGGDADGELAALGEDRVPHRLRPDRAACRVGAEGAGLRHGDGAPREHGRLALPVPEQRVDRRRELLGADRDDRPPDRERVGGAEEAERDVERRVRREERLALEGDVEEEIGVRADPPLDPEDRGGLGAIGALRERAAHRDPLAQPPARRDPPLPLAAAGERHVEDPGEVIGVERRGLDDHVAEEDVAIEVEDVAPGVHA